MMEKERIPIASLGLPDRLAAWARDAAAYEHSGQSGARTVYLDRDGGAYVKIAARGALAGAARMQRFFAEKGLSAPVIAYESADRDYLVTAPVAGEDATAPEYLACPERLADALGQAVRQLHGVDLSGCPSADSIAALVKAAQTQAFLQPHLDLLAEQIGPARAQTARAEVLEKSALLTSDALIHGDCCLPNILLKDWAFTGFVDVADGGIGDRHYDLAWTLWSLAWNLKSTAYGGRFLDAYGREAVDPDRLRVCGLLASLE